jgi:hypothetical protein
MAQGDLVQRMIGAATLRIDTYEEVEADETATGQAAAVVAMVAVAAAIGAVGTGSVLWAPVSAIIGWLVWAGVTYLIGDKLLGGTATWGELLRTLGFAQAPGLLYFFGVIPFIGALVLPIVWIWMLVAGIVAIRQALDFSTGNAILTAFLGFAVMVILRTLF